ncbi:interleukin-17 receptor A [Myxocyprinus asiaticus]|uniref:interleukin-17 receptor A n=1 Tax=Myxocyprinus asiaticus TaxID=70543 RepID=UPI002221B8BB|nr:interleukin-17 receptor A [Myxocyprinus asiaticus]
MNVSFLLLMLASFVLKTSPLHLIDLPPMECSQKGLACKVQVGNCSDEGWVMPRYTVPGFPQVTSTKVTAYKDKSGQFVPILNLTWSQLPDGTIFSLKGTEMRVVEMATNDSVCVRYIFLNTLPETKNPKFDMWTFSLDRVVVNTNFKYQVFVTNLPKPDIGSLTAITTITVPENIWNHKPCWSVGNIKKNDLALTVHFKSEEFSDQYIVSVHSPDLHPEPSKVVKKDNQTLLKLTFTLEAWRITHCSLELVIKPLSVQYMNNCLIYREKIDICPYLPDAPLVFIVLIILEPLLAILAVVGCCIGFLQYRKLHKETLSIDSFTCAKSKVEWNPIQEHKKVLIIYSLDHPLYKEIILKLCAFLRAKCGTDVTLDLLESAWLSTIGRIQWLDMQRERISKTSDRALILCSPGVYAKWKAMCGGHRVRLKEDECSPIGDMLTPALSLIIPDFVQASSFEKYIVAYFDDVCCEDDVPAPFNIVVKYKLMKHFEELYFRILDMEKHEPGRIKCIKGIGENDYFNCPSGKALQNAIETFQNYQLKNPNWFEMELLGKDDQEEATSFKSIFPTDMNYNPVTECYQFIEEHKAQTLINMIKCQSKDEHVLMTSVEETGILLNEYSSVGTTDFQYSCPKLNSFTAI